MSRLLEWLTVHVAQHLWAVAGLMLAAHRRDAFAKLAQHKWSNLLTPGVEWLVESFRERNATLLLNAYSNVSIGVAAGTLGLEPDAAVAFLAVRGWSKDGALLVAPPVAAIDAATQAAIAKSQDIGAEEVARLAEQVLFVEQ